MTDKLKELLPCPFCGDTPSEVSFVFSDGGYKYGAIQCSCGVIGSDVRTDYKDFPHWRDAAVEQWNTRAPAVEAAEIEVVDVIGYFNPDNLARVKADEISGFMLHDEESERINTAAMTVAQHRRILAGVNQQAGSGVPEGWKLVPINPTDHMTWVGQSMRPDAEISIGSIYCGMITAAPLPPSPAAKAGE